MTNWLLMDSQKKIGSVMRPPFSNGSNYVYWKVQMRVFLRSIDKHVWLSMLEGWSPLIIIIIEGSDSVIESKPLST